MVEAFRASSSVSSREDAKRRKFSSTLIVLCTCSAVVLLIPNVPVPFHTPSNQLQGLFQMPVAVEQNGGRRKSANPQDRRIPIQVCSFCGKQRRKRRHRAHSPSQFAPLRT